MKTALSLLLLLSALFLILSSVPSIGRTEGGTYQRLAYQDAVAAGIDPTLFVRQIQQESGFNPNAHSLAGAIGIAQFMPETAQGLGINPHDPVASLWGAAHLMARYLTLYGGSESLALAAYNAGTGTVNACLHTSGGWERCLPRETQQYIQAIIG